MLSASDIGLPLGPTGKAALLPTNVEAFAAEVPDVTADDVLLFWPQHILEIADRMDAAGLKVTWEGSTRANSVTDDLIRRLSRSGLVRLSFGLETIDPKMRETMGKKIPIHFYPTANRICREYGVFLIN